MMPDLHPQIDAELANRIIGALARRQLNLFAAYPEITHEEIVSEATVAVMRQWHQYDPRYAQSTFITQRAATAIIDFSRRAKSGKRRIKRLLQNSVESDFSTQEETPYDESDMPLDEWLVKSQATARRVFGGRVFRQRRTFNLPQMVALAMLRRRFRLSCRGVARVLADRPELLTALKLCRAPGHMTILRADWALDRFAEQQAVQREPVSS